MPTPSGSNFRDENQPIGTVVGNEPGIKLAEAR
jgi:hypothetical protein